MDSSKADGGPPPQGEVMQMLMGAWVSQTISAIARLDVPDILEEHGPLTAGQLTRDHGVDAKPELLERVLRTCAIESGIDKESHYDPSRMGSLAARRKDRRSD